MATLLRILSPLLGVVLNALGGQFNDFLSRKRAEQGQQDLGRVTAERDQAKATGGATQRELEASLNAPQSTDDAISRLEDGSA
jgi:hypothetical protein